MRARSMGLVWLWCTVICALGPSGAQAAGDGVVSRPAVPLTVLPESGQVAVLYTRVTINGHGYLFRVDTGAARTVITGRVADELRLRTRGRPYQARTLGCATPVQPVRVSRWSLPRVTLAPATIASQRDVLGGVKVDNMPVSGLLGSDVLSRFGDVTFDFAARQMLLGGPPARGHSIPMGVNHDPVGGTFETVRVAFGGTPGKLLVDTGSPLTLITAHTASQNSVQTSTRSMTVRGAAGCSSQVHGVEVKNWTAGNVRLPDAFGFSSSNPAVGVYGDQKINGLLGLAVLSSFHRVTLEFAAGRIVLSTPAGSGAPVAAIVIIVGAVVILSLALVWVLRRERGAEPGYVAQTDELKA